jgi:hypothetical protein
MSLNVRKFVVYGGTILVSLALLALSILVGNYEEVRRGVFLHRGFGLLPFQGAVFIFGRHLPGWQGVFSVIGAYLFLYLSGMVMLFLIPRQIGVMLNAFLPAHEQRGLRNWLFFLGVGILSLLALILLAGLGLVTDAAFPLPLFMLALLLLIIWIGLITFGLVLGAGISRLAGSPHSGPLGELSLGLLVVFALGRLPFIGWLFTLFMVTLSLGAVVITHLGSGGQWTLNDLERAPAPQATDSSTHEPQLGQEVKIGSSDV